MRNQMPPSIVAKSRQNLSVQFKEPLPNEATKSLDKEILASTQNLESQLARRKNSTQSSSTRSQQLQERMNAIS